MANIEHATVVPTFSQTRIEQGRRTIEQYSARTEIVRAREADDLTPAILVTGVSASGKDYLLRAAFPDLPEDFIVSSGSVLSKMTNLSRDKLRDLSVEENVALQERLPEYLPTTPHIFNTHLAPRMSEVSQLINGDFLRQYRPAQYIVFVSDPGSVQKWRAAENTTGVRDRLLETADGIHNHQMRLLQVADKFSAESGAGMAVVYNRQNTQATEQNIAFLRDIASNVFSEK